MPDLAARLRDKGFAIPQPGQDVQLLGLTASVPNGLFSPSVPNVSGSSRGGTSSSIRRSVAAAAHTPLAISGAEQKQLFTPLASQGKHALAAEMKFKEEDEKDVLQGVHSTLRRWVQECLAREQKLEKLRERGSLKCRVQVPWSDGLPERLRQLVAGYGGILSADSETDKTSKPAWLPRQEKWLISFDSRAFELFMEAYPEVVEPPEAKIRAFLEEFAQNEAGENKAKVAKALPNALESCFGPLRPELLQGRVPSLIADIVAGSRKRKGAEWLEWPDEVSGRKRSRLDPCPLASPLKTAEDVRWARAVLAPLGLRSEGSGLVAFAPAAVAGPVLAGLASLADSVGGALPGLLRETQLGKVVNAYRNHTNAELARVARELVVAWKEAVRPKGA